MQLPRESILWIVCSNAIPKEESVSDSSTWIYESLIQYNVNYVQIFYSSKPKLSKGESPFDLLESHHKVQGMVYVTMCEFIDKDNT